MRSATCCATRCFYHAAPCGFDAFEVTEAGRTPWSAGRPRSRRSRSGISRPPTGRPLGLRAASRAAAARRPRPIRNRQGSLPDKRERHRRGFMEDLNVRPETEETTRFDAERPRRRLGRRLWRTWTDRPLLSASMIRRRSSPGASPWSPPSAPRPPCSWPWSPRDRAPAVPVIFLETGKHFEETLDYRDELTAELGLSDVRSVKPDWSALLSGDPGGTLWEQSANACCHLRKVLPLKRALAGFDAWITGRKRYQGAVRWDLPPHRGRGRQGEDQSPGRLVPRPGRGGPSRRAACRSIPCWPTAISRSAASPAPSRRRPAPTCARGAGPASPRASAAFTWPLWAAAVEFSVGGSP